MSAGMDDMGFSRQQACMHLAQIVQKMLVDTEARLEELKYQRVVLEAMAKGL